MKSKKIVACLLIVLITTILSSYSFSQKCRKCVKERKENKSCMSEIGIATRDFSVPTQYINGVPHATYRCCYGHHYLVSLKD